jgi:hypothetical protein
MLSPYARARAYEKLAHHGVRRKSVSVERAPEEPPLGGTAPRRRGYAAGPGPWIKPYALRSCCLLLGTLLPKVLRARHWL